MKAVSASAVAILALSCFATLGAAQPYRDGDRVRGDEERLDRGGERRAEFDEGEYLRCNPDVDKAVNRGTTTAMQHYREYGRREGRRLSC